MRNLKRVLTMVMAIAMLMSLMVVGAGAAFSDSKDIANKDAVEKMVSLNIINGRDDGTFDPTGIVTRAEMAKMIAIALNGGNDPKLSASSVVTSSFTDTKNHWAAGYIEYAVNLGIVAGLGDNTFAPDQGVTATQAAKMLLVALGYDAQHEKFVGTTWALNVNKVAMQKGLYEDIQGIDPNAPMSRDNAAQMTANFCDGTMVKYEFGISGTGGNVTGVKQAVDIAGQTILSKYYKLRTAAGTMDAVTYDSKKTEYGYTVAGTAYKTTVDFTNMMGMKVEVLYRDKDNSNSYNSGDSVYDINTDDSVIIATGVMDNFGKYNTSDKTLKFADKTYDVDATVTSVRAFDGTAGPDLTVNAGTGKGELVGVTGAYDVKLIDNDDNGKIDLVVYTPFTVNKVTFAGSTNTTFTMLSGGAAIGNVKNEDFIGYTGIAKDDIVAYYATANAPMAKATAVKMEVKTGTISGVKATEYMIDGNWYTNATATTLNAGDAVKYVAVGNVLYFIDITDYAATTKDVLAVYNSAWVTVGMTDEAKAKVMFADGTKKEVVVAKIDGKTVVESGAAAGEIDYNDASALVAGTMFTYKVNKDGEYELTNINAATNKAGHDVAVVAGDAYDNKTVGAYELADDAIVIVVAGTDAKTYTGKEMKNTYAAGTYGTVATALVNKVNGFNYTKLAVITAGALPTITNGSNYGYMLDDAWTSIENGDTYRNFKIWTVNGQVTVKEKETASLAGFVEGAIVTYDNAGDNLVKNVEVATTTKAVVTGWDGTKKISIAGLGNSEVTKDDTTILYVDTDKVVGVAEGAISLGDDTDGNGTPDRENVYYIGNTTVLKLLVVDVTNNIK